MLLLFDERMGRHDPGRGHPESPARLRAVQQALEPLAGPVWRAPRLATRAELERVHSAPHIDQVEQLRGRAGAFDADTSVSPGSIEAAYLAAGAAVEAVEEAVRGEHRQVFALVRPPGHHAESGHAMGFCLFNNVAVAAEHALAQLDCERVLIVDWDVHHGNGTQHSFAARRDVLFFSVHQFPFYPGTGALEERGQGAGEGYTINVPFPGGQGDGDYIGALSDVLLPAAERFAPDLVLVSAGFDAHRSDPLAGMHLSTEGYAAMMGLVRDIAERHADGRLVMTLEGGYDLDALAESARACVEVLHGASPPSVGSPTTSAAGVLRAVRDGHRATWGT
jgi:acetoin utilization deacetylase AcuC-like enzyme